MAAIGAGPSSSPPIPSTYPASLVAFTKILALRRCLVGSSLRPLWPHPPRAYLHAASRESQDRNQSKMVSDLRIVHPPSASANPSEHPIIVVAVGSSKYVFNVPEGATRSAIHRHLSVGGPGQVDLFVPHTCTGSRGLSGLLMTLADTGKSCVNIFGPPGLAHAIATMRLYCKRQGCQISVKESHTIGGSTRESSIVPSSADGLLMQEGGVTIRALSSWSSDWRQAPLSATTPPLSRENSRKRRRSSSPSSSVEIAPPISNAEHDAAEFAARDLLSAQMKGSNLHVDARSSRDRSFAAVQSMFNSEAGKEPRADSRRLPEPWIAPHAEGSRPAAPASQPVSLSFVMSLPDLPGKVDVARARAVGICPGPNLAKLQMGESVVIKRPVDWEKLSEQDKAAWLRQAQEQLKTPGGKNKKAKAKAGGQQPQQPPPQFTTEDVTIESSACVGASVPGSVLVMTNIPSRSHLPAFLSSDNARTLQETTRGRPATVVIHSSPADVVRDTGYQSWVQRVSSDETRHIYTSAGTGSNSLLYPASLLPLLRMSTLDADLFKVPPYSLQRRVDATTLHNGDSANVSVLDEALTMRLQPRSTPPTLDADTASFDFEIDSTTGDDARKKHELIAYVRDKDAVVGTARKSLTEARSAAFKEFQRVSQRVRAEVEAMVQANQGVEHDAWKDVKVTTLGTGSAQPSRYRGVAATLLEFPARFRRRDDKRREPFYILLDAGDGTLGQLAQHFGSKEALDTMLRNLRLFFVSHIHGDHCSGVNALLRARAELQANECLYVVAGNYIRTFIAEWNALEDLRIFDDGKGGKPQPGDVVLLEAEHLDYKLGIQPPSDGDAAYFAHLRQGNLAGYQRSLDAVRRRIVSQPPFDTMDERELDGEQDEIEKRVQHALGWKDPSSDSGRHAQEQFEAAKRAERTATRRVWSLLQADLGGHIAVNTVQVDHRARHCYGVVVRFSDTDDSTRRFAVSYSGDTRPTPQLEEAARGVDLFIHEATIQDEEPEMAFKKGHSTVGGAIASGKKAQAKVTLLTHFSQRYPQMARLSNGGGGGEASSSSTTTTPILAVGMDMLSLNMNDAWKMNRYLPAMEVLFKADAVGAPEEDKVVGGTD